MIMSVTDGVSNYLVKPLQTSNIVKKMYTQTYTMFEYKFCCFTKEMSIL